MASWLASDMMKMQPSKENGKDKITSANYRALQRSLAISDVQNWHGVFESAKLVGQHSSIKHPFLEETGYKKCRDIQQFYLGYLEARKAYFESWENKVAKKAMKGATQIQFQDEAVFTKLFDKYNQKATPPKNNKFLPRGIFTEVIKNYFKENGCDEMKTVVNGKANVAFIIQKYFETVEKDALPNVYAKNRHYAFFDLLRYALKNSYFENVQGVLEKNKPTAPHRKRIRKL